MSIRKIKLRLSQRIAAAAMRLASVSTLGMGLLGCAHSQSGGGRLTEMGGFSPAETLALLTGPVSLLASNAAGFNAHVTVISTAAAANTPPSLTGTLWAQPDWLLWTPAAAKGHSPSGGGQSFSFIWHVSQSSGYALSEALQAYAPITTSWRYTNFTVAPDPENAPSENLDGHLCHPEQITAGSSDGTTHRFRVWRAEDLKEIPLKVVAIGDYPTTTVLLSQVRVLKSAPDRFEPPNDFTRYENAEAMANELLLRQQNLQQRPDGGNAAPGMRTPPAASQGHPASRTY